MNSGIKLRLAIFISGIAFLLVLIAWVAHTSWREIGDLRVNIANMQSRTFRIADHLEQGILELNNTVLRFAAYREAKDWADFETNSQELAVWLDDLQPTLASDDEHQFMDHIHSAYGDYLKAAKAINTRIYTSHQSITRVLEFTDFERQSRRILDLSFQLTKANQEKLDTFQAETLRSLGVLRMTLFGCLLLLLAAGAGLAAVVYRGMISPLQVQLVESRQILERQEKLASLGMLAAGVAHEIRNPLTAIKAWLFLKQKHLTPGTADHEDVCFVAGEINRLERIVKDFLTFARPSEPQFELIPTAQPLTEVQKLLAPELEKSKINLMLADVYPAKVQADPQQIKQVLINLVQNAADSIGENGTITLRARKDEKKLEEQLTQVIIFEVIDTGKGIQPEAEKRLFDPFFTTKDTGTGLGLPIAARIIEKNKGALQYQTKLDHGTTFGIILPLQKNHE
jgi:signal transduction histidine kinase